MLIVDLPTKRIGVQFKHKPYMKPTLDTSMCKRFLNGITHCSIYLLNGIDAATLVEGTGFCKWPDSYCKAMGRRQSLTSALANRIGTGKVFSRVEREIIWRAYWRSLEPPAEPTAAIPKEKNESAGPGPVGAEAAPL